MKHHWNDPVVEEVRERGRQLTTRFDNDVRQIAEYLRQREREYLQQCPELYVSQIRVLPSEKEAV